MVLSKPHSIFACPTAVSQTWIPNRKWKLTVFDPQWNWIHRCEGLTVESQVIHRISTVFKGHCTLKHDIRDWFSVGWLWSDGTMIRHFPESPFYKTEQSGAVLGKWGWGGLELHPLLPWPSVVSPLRTILRGVKGSTSWGSSEAWLCLQLALGSRQLTEAFWTSLSIKWTDQTRSKRSSPVSVDSFRDLWRLWDMEYFVGFCFFSGETWYSFISFLEGSCSPKHEGALYWFLRSLPVQSISYFCCIW